MSFRAHATRIRLELAMGTIAIASPSVTAGAAQNAVRPAAAAAPTYADCVAEAAQRFGLPETWIWAVMRAESRGDPRAVSRAGAIGLMQIMPATWTGLTARYALGSDPFDVRANIHAGAAYLREMLDRYGDLGMALAAYNAGPARVDDWRARARSLPAETSGYVARIASAVGVSASPSVIMPRAPSITWRNASLFTVRRDGASAGTNDAVLARPIDKAAAPVVPESSQRPADPLPTNPLFVAHSGRGAP